MKRGGEYIKKKGARFYGFSARGHPVGIHLGILFFLGILLCCELEKWESLLEKLRSFNNWNHITQQPDFISICVNPNSWSQEAVRLVDGWGVSRFCWIDFSNSSLSASGNPSTRVYAAQEKSWEPAIASTLLHITEMICATVMMTVAPVYFIMNQRPSLF